MLRQFFISGLSEKKQFILAIKLLKLALSIWENYADKNKLFFFHSHNNQKHTVKKNLLRETVEFVERFYNTSNFQLSAKNIIKNVELETQFLDLEEAITNSDWELPEEVFFTFNAVSILIQTVSEIKLINYSDEISFYASINQAIVALETSGTLGTEEINGIVFTI
jgi:hypothetical protein